MWSHERQGTIMWTKRVLVQMSLEQYIKQMLKTLIFCSENLSVRLSVLQTIET